MALFKPVSEPPVRVRRVVSVAKLGQQYDRLLYIDKDVLQLLSLRVVENARS